MNDVSRVKYEIITREMLYLPVMSKCADLYCRIWKEPPWNEDDWTIPIVLDKVRTAYAKLGFIGYLALCANKPGGFADVVGFTWGFRVKIDEMAEISSHRLLDPLFTQYSRIFYLAKLGVGSEYRAQGVGALLSRTLIDRGKQQEMDAIVLRTDMEAIPARKLYERLGFKELTITDQQFPGRSYWVLAR